MKLLIKLECVNIGKTHKPTSAVFCKCLVDNKDISANPRARKPPKSIGNLKKPTLKHPPLGGMGGWVGGECVSVGQCHAPLHLAQHCSLRPISRLSALITTPGAAETFTST